MLIWGKAHKWAGLITSVHTWGTDWVYSLMRSRWTKSSRMFDRLVICLYGLFENFRCCGQSQLLRFEDMYCHLRRGLHLLWFVLHYGPGHINVLSAKRMWPYAAQTTSECGLSNQISMCPQCIFTLVLRAAHTPGYMLETWFHLVFRVKPTDSV